MMLSSAAVLYWGMRRAAKSRIEQNLFAVISLTLGPMLMSWLLVQLLYFLPEQSKYFYLGVLAVAFVIPGLLATPGLLGQLLGSGKDYFLSMRGIGLPRLVALAFTYGILAMLGQLLLHQLFIPIWANDPQEYAQVSHFLAQTLNAHNYPVTDSTTTDGLFAPWTHPLGYVGLQVIARMLEGGGEQSLLISLFTPYFALTGALALAAIAGAGRPAAGPVAAYVMLATPIYFHLAVQAHIDVMRLAVFLCAFIAVWLVARRPALTLAVIAGVACGMSQFTHSIGFITLPLMLPLLAIISLGSFRETARNIGVILVVATAFVLLRLAINLSTYGVLIGDSAAVWEIEALRETEHRAVLRLLYTPFDVFVRAILRGWSDLPLFGYSYWLATIGMVGALIAWRRQIADVRGLVQRRIWQAPEPAMAAFIVVVGFFGMVLLSVAGGTDIIIKNARYLLTIQPMVAMIAGYIFTYPFTTPGPSEWFAGRSRDSSGAPS